MSDLGQSSSCNHICSYIPDMHATQAVGHCPVVTHLYFILVSFNMSVCFLSQSAEEETCYHCDGYGARL